MGGVKTHTTSASQHPKARNPTSFELRLYKVCAAIPVGRVSTYGTLAKVLGSSPRAVGQALRRNPYAPVVPCHRVISSNLQLGGFQGTWGATAETQKKEHLLKQEGVYFVDGHLATTMAVMDAKQLAGACKHAL